MSAFANTCEVLGDVAAMDALNGHNLPEKFVDDKITRIKDYILREQPFEIVECSAVTEVGVGAFLGCTSLKNIVMPSLRATSQNAFSRCAAVTLSFPALQSIGYGTFTGCENLQSISIPEATRLYTEAFNNCIALTSLDAPKLVDIGVGSFKGCTAFATLILRSETMCTLKSSASNLPFGGTPIASGAGYIYVPAALVDTYKAATNWSTYANQFRALEDYTVDGTVTGELDETKI